MFFLIVKPETMMIEAIEKRRSIRKYLKKEVEDEKIKSVIEAARLAPSGNNTQPWHFIIVRDGEMKKRVVEVSNNQTWMLSAPVLIIPVADIRVRVEEGTVVYLDEMSPMIELKKIIRDTAIATEHAVLEAYNQGLGTCWVAWFQQDSIRPLLGIPDDKYVLCVLTLGYPAEDPARRKRKELSKFVHYNRW